MKKIMFNDRYGLTEAVLSGRKTMTRRIVSEGVLRMAKMETEIHKDTLEHRIEDHRFYCYLDEVSIQQSYSDLREILVLRNFKRTDTIYDDFYRGLRNGDISDTEAGWNNKMFAKAKYMPHRIRITGLKVERLQDITDRECLCEGVEQWLDGYIVTGIMERNGKNNVCFDTPREAFATLIDRISGKGTWERNPWVYAYTFELVR